MDNIVQAPHSQPIECKRCHTVYTDEEFLAAHPGPYAQEALRIARTHPPINCGSCEVPLIAIARPE